MKTQYVVQEGIAIKHKNSARKGGSEPKYPFKTMKKGSSFQVGEYSSALMTRVGMSARYYAKKARYGKYLKFATRKVWEKDIIDGVEKFMVRIWRIQ